MSEKCKRLIISISALNLGLESDNQPHSQLSSDPNISHFLQEPSSVVLYVTLLRDNVGITTLKFHLQVPAALEDDTKVVVFYKVRSGASTVITETNFFETVQCASIIGSATASLYYSLQNVFSPLINSHQNKIVNDPAISKRLFALQEELQTKASLTDSTANSQQKDYSLYGIFCLEDEVTYWKNILQTSENRSRRDSASTFLEILQPLIKDFSSFNEVSLTESEDILESGHNALDDLWRGVPPYPSTRVQHLMDMIALVIVKQVKKSLTVQTNDAFVWTCEFYEASGLLNQCLGITKSWIGICQELTGTFWPNCSSRVWKGEKYVPNDLVNLAERLQEILEVRSIHRQVTVLLTASEEEGLQMSNMFKPFQDIDFLNCEQRLETPWKDAIKQFHANIQEAEEIVGNKLKVQFTSNNFNTRQFLFELGRYSDLIRRPAIKQLLLTERHVLLNSLNEHVQKLQFETEKPAASSKYSTPEVVQQIMRVRELESTVSEIIGTSKKILDDVNGFEELDQSLKLLLSATEQQNVDLFDSWTAELNAKIKSNKMSLKESDNVVHLLDGGKMQVNYSPYFITLINEVRQLTAMGYTIPGNICEISEHAKRFATHAKTLEQISHFHNTIGDRMIASQRPMMLACALELSKLLQEQELVSWTESASVQKYIDKLMLVVEKLSNENGILTTYHIQVMQKIHSLENIHLIKYYETWRNTAKEIRHLVAEVSQKGFTNMQQWKDEIDNEFSKVMERQYRESIEALHQYLPEIRADLVYRNGTLQISPNEETLKEKHKHQMKHYLDIPKRFYGVSENSNAFSKVIERCAGAIEKVTASADEVFEQLRSVMKHWESWAVIDNSKDLNLSSWQQWDLQFLASKSFGQEIAKLPSAEEKVGCFVVGLSVLRNDLESHNRSYWLKLTSSLKDSIVEDLQKLQQHVDTTTLTLNRPTLTLEEIGSIDTAYSNILEQQSSMEKMYEEMMKKAQILSSWTREKIDSVNRLETAWERLHTLLANHEHIMAKQMETMKASLTTNVGNLHHDLEIFAGSWKEFASKQAFGNDLRSLLSAIKEKRKECTELLARKESLLSNCARLNMVLPELSSLKSTAEDLIEQEATWKLFEEFYSDLDLMRSEEWIMFRKKLYRLEEFLITWQEKLQDVDASAIVITILKQIDEYQTSVPSLKYVKGDDFTDKHWMQVYSLLGMPPKAADVLVLGDFLDVAEALAQHSTELQAICRKSVSEIVVRQALMEIDRWDMQTRFSLNPHTDSRGRKISLIKDFKDILNSIGDNQSLLQSVKNSSDYESFSERVDLWETRLADLDVFLMSLAHIQRKWLYLEPIFNSGTLNQNKNRFDSFDKEFSRIMQYVQKDSRVTALNRYPNLKATLGNLNEQSSRCQNSLDTFLSEKRSKFPRFLFLMDDDLLEIVGQFSKEQVIQQHLKKLFAGIHSIKLDTAKTSIIAICSAEGEVVNLSQSVNVNQPVENWMNGLVKEMHGSLKSLLLYCYSEGSNADPMKYPSQIMCLADSILFTSKCEEAIGSMKLPTLLSSYKTQLNYYSSLEMHKTGDEVTKNTADSSVLEHKLKALLLDTIHHIDVIEELIEANVTDVWDWNWQKQLRYYLKPDGNVDVKMVNATMEYSFEYLGNPPKLVRTTLTEKCFLALTQGIHLGMGGNLYGPAGTGKTETVKALGSSLGRQVFVFNCDEGVDATAMDQILKGLVLTGAWGCFDEFNRLEEATLSAISMQIQLIQNALLAKRGSVIFLDQKIHVNKHCGIFVTLNPAGEGYGARNKLPDNLKQLFRPVVMTEPDHEQIARTLLHCDGFGQADEIGRKLVEIFSMAKKLLGQEKHYDWGLRALKSVLNGCRGILRRNVEAKIEADSELRLVVKALLLDTASKLTYSDRIKFDSLIGDVFPESKFESSENNDLVKALEESYLEFGLQSNKRQLQKCVELYEQLQQRMGVALIGPPNSGKTTIRTLLFHALKKIGRNVKKHVLNPKAMHRKELLGYIDLDTRQWTDGVLTVCSLNVTLEPPDVWSWIVCDGDIDPDWIESLNSVLDDNKLLSLPSGWRIQFDSNVNFVFETDTLTNASPATVSRLGIVYLSQEDLSVSDVILSFVDKQSEMIQYALTEYIQEYFYNAIDWIVTRGEFSKISLAQSGLSHFYGVTSKPQFLVALFNGLCGYLKNGDREAFSQEIFADSTEFSTLTTHTVFYNKDLDTIGHYEKSMTPGSDFNGNNLNLPLILTDSIFHTLDCLRPWLNQGNEQHFFLIGPHGSAKTLILEHLVAERGGAEIATVYCSAHTEPRDVIATLKKVCMIISSNTGGRVYKPRKGHLVLHFQNMHLLENDKWDTNILSAFLHQFISCHGFFDSNLEWIGIENVTIVGTLEEVRDVSPRLVSLMHIFHVSIPSTDDLTSIFTLYLTEIVTNIQGDSPILRNKVELFSKIMMDIYKEVRSAFNEVYNNFTPHNLTQWCDSILQYKYERAEGNVEHFLLMVMNYEALHMFGDRLGTKTDKDALYEIIDKEIKKAFPKVQIPDTRELFFVASSSASQIPHEQPKLSKNTSEEWIASINKGIRYVERDGEVFNVVINDEFICLTSAIDKELSVLGRGLLLIGTAGIGRKSSVKLVAALRNAKVVIPTVPIQPHFNVQLKSALQHAGLNNEEVYLVLENHILRQEKLLDVVNVLLCSGEVSGLYTSNEFDSLIAGLKEDASHENYDGSLAEFFTSRIKKRLHVIVSLDHNNENLQIILKRCPALHQKCSVISLPNWSDKSLENLPNVLIKKVFKEDFANEDNSELNKSFLKVGKLVDPKLATPHCYMSMINTYAKIFAGKRSAITERQSKLQAGILKLQEAKEVVTSLRENAVKQREKLSEKQAKANAALDMISSTMQNANSRKEEMESLKESTMKESQQLAKRKEEIETELAEVQPLIDDARSAVGNIKSEALTEIRSLRAPPDVIRDILEGVLRLMGTQDTSWNSMKNFLSRRGIKEDIRSFDASRITTENRQSVEQLVSNRAASFDAKNAKRASVAAAPLAAWVTANVKYSRVLDKIKPLEREQSKLEQNLISSKLQLEELSTNLTDVDSTVKKLKEQLNTYTKEATEIEFHLNEAEGTLAAAESLVYKLDDEYERWKEQSKNLSDELEILSPNCLLASAFVTYLAEKPENIRTDTLAKWCKEITDQRDDWTFSLTDFLISEREQTQWRTEGLGTDLLSVQNAIVIFNTTICPLLLDPTSAAVNWTKSHFNDKTAETVTQDSEKFNTTLELAVRFGKTLIIEEVETISPALFPLLRNQYVYQGERKMVMLNGKLVDCHRDFRLLLSSRNVLIDLPTDVSSIVNVVNFTMTPAGLTEQLLTGVVRQELPELEDRIKNLLYQKEELQEKQHNLQNQLLEDLGKASGDILKNKKLLDSLNNTKESSIAINSSIVESEQLQTQLQNECDKYRDISEFGSSLYFAIQNFSKHSVLYSISVSAYLRLFLRSLPQTDELLVNKSSARRSVMQNVYTFMSRNVFKKDRLLFALHLTKAMFPQQILEEEWNAFLGQNVVASNPDSPESVPSWIANELVQNVTLLQSSLPDVFKQLQLHEQHSWKDFMERRNCEAYFPANCKVTEFEKVLVTQALRPDRLCSVLTQSISHITGIKDINPEVLQLSEILRESLPSEPILLIASPGNDPSSELKELARGRDYVEVALGAGQETKALDQLDKAAESGQWITLKNLHLVTSWLPILCQKLQSLTPHEQFRLWLITEPHERFSPVLAQSSFKVAYEISPNIRDNLLHTYNTWGSSYVEKLNAQGKRIFFAIACVHSIFHQRKTYIPQGWSKEYEFNDNDLSTLINLGEAIWQAQKNKVRWGHLIGLCCFAVYGSRIENLQDFKILESYVRQYFCEDILSNYWKPLGLNTSIPSHGDFKEYVSVIKQIPESNLFQHIGLPENVDCALEKYSAEKIIVRTKEFSREKRATGKSNRKNVLALLDLWKRLNNGRNYFEITSSDIKPNSSLLLTFLSDEFDTRVTLVRTVHKNLSSLNRMLKTKSVNTEMKALISELSNHKTPNSWLQIWRGPKEINKYLTSLTEHIPNAQRWRMIENVETFLTTPINLASFLDPDLFLATYKQEYSRKSGVSMDKLSLRTSWKTSETPFSVILTGLKLEGALFDGYNLSPCSSNSSIANSVPDCHISWIQKENVLVSDRQVNVPLYRSSSRDSGIVLYLQVPCGLKEGEKWIQAGLAFYINN